MIKSVRGAVEKGWCVGRNPTSSLSNFYHFFCHCLTSFLIGANRSKVLHFRASMKPVRVSKRGRLIRYSCLFLYCFFLIRFASVMLLVNMKC